MSSEQDRIADAVYAACAKTPVSPSDRAVVLAVINQGIAKGALDFEGLRVIAEFSPHLIKALTEEFGLSRGQLRDHARQGLPANRIVTALLAHA